MDGVVIVGCPGAGKSTAARRLAQITSLPLIHLDRYYWLPGWVRPDNKTWQAKVHELVAQPRWIMDGNYIGTLDLRLSAADTLVHLDFSTLVCASRVMWRTLTRIGQQRGEELGPGCSERLDWPFFRFVLEYRRRYRGRDMAQMASFGGDIYRFASPAALESFLSGLEKDFNASKVPFDAS